MYIALLEGNTFYIRVVDYDYGSSLIIADCVPNNLHKINL